MARGTTSIAQVADHVVPHNGDVVLFWTGELQSLCQEHHRGTKKEMEYQGYSSDIGVDGWPIDPMHPANNPMTLMRPSKQKRDIPDPDLIG
jgi:5-methylcytosine-specific restriction enzyme A